MSGFVKVGLRLVRTTRYLQSMCHVRNGSSHAAKNSITSAQKKSAGYWKIISAVTKKTLLYSTIPLTIIVGYFTYKVKTNPRFWENLDMIIAVDDETLKYSIIPSKIITSSVLFDDGEIKINTREDNITLINDNTRNLVISEELNANIQEPFPKGKPIPIKIGKFNGLLDNGKLTLKTEDGDTTFTFNHTLCLKVKKSSENLLLTEIAANKKEEPEIAPSKIGKFNVLSPDSKITLKTPKIEKKWTNIKVNRSAPEVFSPSLPLYDEIFPIIGNFSFSSHSKVKIQKDESDEVYYFKHRLNIECEKKLDENLQNKIAAEKELPKDETTAKVSLRDILTEEIKTCNLMIDSGTVVFKTQDGDKFAIRQISNIEIFEDDGKIYFDCLPHYTVFDS